VLPQDPRALFDIPPEVAYLNCAYMSPLPRPVLEAGRAGLERKARPWQVRPSDFFDEPERARTLFAALVGGDVALQADPLLHQEAAPIAFPPDLLFHGSLL
jgi:hypothetical protein